MKKNFQKMVSFINNDYSKFLFIVSIILACIFIGANFIRIFDNNFWIDELYSINLSHMSVSDLITATSFDVHPPLFYLILKAFSCVFGSHGWVFHLVPFISYLGCVIVCLTLVRKEFNTWTSLIFLGLVSLLYNATNFIIEVRGYEWAAFLMLLSFIYFRKLLREETLKNSVLFTLFSLLAAYTHYFCILGLSSVYLILMIHALRKKGKLLKFTLGIWGSTIVLYLPWCITFFINLQSNSGKIFSAAANSVSDCMKYIFDSKFTYLFLILMFTFSIYLLIRSKDLTDKLWIISGLLGLVITIAFPFIVSAIASPILFVRNIYPVCIWMWLILSYSATKIKIPNIIGGLLILLIVPFGLSTLKYTYDCEKRQQVSLDNLLSATRDAMIENHGILVSSEEHLTNPAMKYYYPDVDFILIDSEEAFDSFIKENRKQDLWIFDSSKTEDMYPVSERFKKEGFILSEEFSRGYLGTYTVDVYRVSSVN